MAIRQETAAKLNPEFRQDLMRSMIRYPDAFGVIVYSNHDLSSSAVGHEMALPFGPFNTVKSLDDAVKRKTYPFQPVVGSAWQYYPEYWIPRQEFFPVDAPPIPARS